jgi:hypothetical protein
VGRLVVLPFVAALLLTWWLVGDPSAVGGDAAIVRFPYAERNATTLGIVGAIAALAAIAGLLGFLLRPTHDRVRPPARSRSPPRPAQQPARAVASSRPRCTAPTSVADW